MDPAVVSAFWEGAIEFAWTMFGIVFLALAILAQCGVFDERKEGE